MSGGTAAFANLASLALFVEVFRMHYLPASICAFIIGFAVSFVSQKYFTFGDTMMHMVHRQLVIYFFIAIGNISINTLSVFILVDVVGLWYLFSQALASLLIATISFYLYRRYVFVR